MNAMHYLKKMIPARSGKTNSPQVQDLVLYRQLKRCENQLLDNRERLGRMLASQAQLVSELERLVRSCDELEEALAQAVDKKYSREVMNQLQLQVNRRDELEHRLDGMKAEIDILQAAVKQQEHAYDQAKAHARTYFYQESTPGFAPGAAIPPEPVAH